MTPESSYKSKETAWNGIAIWFYNNNIKWTGKSIDKIVKKFLIENNLPVKNGDDDKSSQHNAEQVQKNWELFKQYIKSQP